MEENIYLRDKEKEMLRLYAKNDMNLAKTAHEMNYSHRGLDYYMEKILRDTGLNPKCFYDLMELLKSFEKI